jgi:hypothetical protein
LFQMGTGACISASLASCMAGPPSPPGARVARFSVSGQAHSAEAAAEVKAAPSRIPCVSSGRLKHVYSDSSLHSLGAPQLSLDHPTRKLRQRQGDVTGRIAVILITSGETLSPTRQLRSPERPPPAQVNLTMFRGCLSDISRATTNASEALSPCF